MLSASLYIIGCSARNRIRVRLRRLKEPKYLIGAIAGVAYFYFTIFARMFGRNAAARSQRGRSTPFSADKLAALQASGPAFVGLAFLILMALAWLYPSDSGLLDFTEPEMQFLFVAPVTRRQLLIHRLLRSQGGLLFASIVPALFVPGGWDSIAWRFQIAFAMFIVFQTMKVHYTGISLARASLLIQGADARRKQWRPLLLMVAAIAVVVTAIVRAVKAAPISDPFELVTRIGQVSLTGLPGIILWPFIAIARPLFVRAPGPYFAALGMAVVVLALNVVWVLNSDAAFQEATAQAAERKAEKASRKLTVPKARLTNWTLALTGRAEPMFFWKNTMQVIRETNALSLLRYGFPLLVASVAMSAAFMSGSHSRNLSAAFGLFGAMIAVFAILMGPQMARSDLRQDLLHLEVLKTWPVRAADVIRGEMLWPAALVTTVAWIAIACATALSAAAFTKVPFSTRMAVAAAGAILAPSVILSQFVIHNAAAVVFPAWVPLGTARPKGIDAMGQRLIMFAGVLIGLAVMLLPGAIAGGLIYLAFNRFIGIAVLVPAALVCTAIVLVEIIASTEMLAPVYEKLDLSGIERSE